MRQSQYETDVARKVTDLHSSAKPLGVTSSHDIDLIPGTNIAIQKQATIELPPVVQKIYWSPLQIKPISMLPSTITGPGGTLS